jgi:hypothetical protein
MKSRLFLLAFVVGVMLLSSPRVMACFCSGGGAPCQEFWRADAVFAGTVVGGGAVTLEEGGHKFERRLVRLTVDQPVRGMQSAEVEVVTGWGETDCGYGFKLGQRYLVYAFREGKEKRLFTSTCSRTRLLTEAADDFAFIRNLPTASANGLIFGAVTKRNHQLKQGDDWFKPVGDVELSIEGENAQYAARSDAEGKFRVENVLPGKYTARLKIPPGFVRPSGRDSSGKTYALEIEVAARGCAQADFYLETDTRVRGRVVDAKGNPVAKMQLDMRVAINNPQTADTFLHAITDVDGNFEFTTVPPGDYLLGYHLLSSPLQEGQPYGRTYLPGVTSGALATIVKVKEGELVDSLTLQLPAPLTARTVTGLIVWSDGQPATDASVFLSLMEEGGPSSFETIKTDEGGRFTLKLYEGLQYKVGAYRSGTGGKSAQSEFLDVPLTVDQPLRLVLPAQSRN